MIATKNKSKSKIIKPVYCPLTIKISSYRAAVDASINPKVADPRRCGDDTKIYSFDSRLDIEGVCTYPEERNGEEYVIWIYGSEREPGEFDLTLNDCHMRDKYGVRKFRKVRGKEVPVYDVPKGVGIGSPPDNWTD